MKIKLKNKIGAMRMSRGTKIEKVIRKRAKRELKKLRDIRPLPIENERNKADVEVVECTNLRRDELTDNLTVRGLPGVNGNLKTLPLLVMQGEPEADTGDGAPVREALVQEGTRLRVVRLDGEDAGYDAGGVSGTVQCAVMTGTEMIEVMTEVDRYRLMPGENGKWGVWHQPVYPALHFEAFSEQRMGVEVGERELKGSYDTHSTELNAADTEQLGKDLWTGYAELADRAMRGGLEMQPVLARYHLEGKNGELLYRSPIVLAGASSGVQGVDSMQCQLDESRAKRGALRVAADVYRLKLLQTGAGTVDPGKVTKLVVETSLPVHPVDANARAANTLSRSGTNGIMLRCFLPGASVTMVSSRRHVAEKLMRLAMKGDVAFREAAVVYNPFDGEGMLEVEIPVNHSDWEGVEAQQATVKAQLATKVEAVAPMVARCMVPNHFMATAGCVAGENVLWGDITVKGFEGYRVEEMTAEFTTEGEQHAWRCVVVTELVSGERCVATSWGTTMAPLTLNPVLSFPRPDAVRMMVRLERDGKLYEGEFPLTPNENGTASVYCDENIGKIELEEIEGSFAYVNDTRAGERHESEIVVARADSPREVIGASSIVTGSIVALKGMDRRGSAWEFGDQRVYAFSTEGIYLTAINKAGKQLRNSRIDSRGVLSGAAVAETDDDKYAVVCIAEGDLVGLQRGNSSTLQRSLGATALGWDGVNDELWVGMADGSAVVKQSLEGGYRRVAGVTVSGFFDTGDGLLIGTDTEVLDTMREGDDEVEFGYVVRCGMEMPEWYLGHGEISGVTVDMRSESVEGALLVRSMDDGGGNLMEYGMTFSGKVNTPLVVWMKGGYGAVVEVVVTGRAKVGSEVRELGIRS